MHPPTLRRTHRPTFSHRRINPRRRRGGQQEQQKRNANSTPVPYLPCLSWGWALVCSGGHSITPILVRAWGCCLQFLRASSPLSMEDDRNNQFSTAGDDVVTHATHIARLQDHATGGIGHHPHPRTCANTSFLASTRSKVHRIYPGQEKEKTCQLY
jgi:hypothetical protein